MALHHAVSGEIMNLKNPNQNVSDDVSTALFKTNDIEVIRRILQPRQAIPEHEVNGDITLQCLSGKVRVKAHGKVQIMSEGELMYISACEPYALEGEEDSIMLMTIVRSRE